MRVYYLGLIDWRDKILPHREQEKVAKSFLGATTVETADGWFRPPNGTCEDSKGSKFEVGVTHSRIIISQDFQADFADFGAFRDCREKLRRPVEKFLVDGANRYLASVEGQQRFGNSPPTPFIYVYPIVILDGESKFFADQFKKSWYSDTDWKVPFDNSTSCFFVKLSDEGIFWASEVFLRVSGASMVIGASNGPSNRFVTQIINLVYYSGLYQMTREKEFQETIPAGTRIHFDLERLLERQGAEILRIFTQRSTDEKLARVTRWLVVLTVALVVVTLAIRVI